MELSQPRAFFGLVSSATPQGSNVSNSVSVGASNAAVSLTSAATLVTFDAVVVGSSSDLVIDVSDLDSTGTTAWTAGTAQVETATAAGTITGAGNAEVIVTASGMTGSPKTLDVAVASTDTASEWAAKVRAALAADADVSALFSISGTGADIVLTRKADFSATVSGATVSVYPANDATLNVSLDNGTCTGITTAATSADTTAGVATAGVYVPDLDGNDFEGRATGGATKIYGVYIANSSTSSDSLTITQGTVLADLAVPVGSTYAMADPAGGLEFADITIEPTTAGPSLVTVVLATD